MNRALVRQVVRFGLVGSLCVLLQIALYALLRTWLPPLVSNLAALLVCTVLNTEANRRFTFEAGRGSAGRTQLQGLLVFAAYYLLTSGALLLLDVVVATPPRRLELAVLVVSSAAGTIGRFVVLRLWVFHRRVLAEENAAFSVKEDT
ncbi:GtrA family protein [Streptomyces sp. NBRC 110028]|uniref:GtrA family protein n=1 Tax=Streptomyces sp. NBRC 110028 TaxID=1621260 RepID=UPI0006E44A02|nr:GtrA family protein [Streptomyces sp. NBRC 110028]